uniref:Cell morphogenesis protein (Cell morphogenesis protein PAG1) n=1 Tax=Ganoderma boninense TaxID=34458 RepID=A0A5K1K6M2_9APHY|nr:Cell morphogenesis protein (Cell morphogenesis protein PAG1) [Ganoderma boninense]
MSSRRLLDPYNVSRQLPNVEALAQQYARYLQIAGEDTEFLSYHVTRRDEIIAEFYSHPEVKSSIAPHQFVQPGEDPNIYLDGANDLIKKHTPPETLEDRVGRLHIAMAALMVFLEFKVNGALRDHPDLEFQVEVRKEQLMDEWYQTEFARLFPERWNRVSRTPSTLTTRGRLPTPPPTRRSGVAKPVSDDEVEEFLRTPYTLMGKRFVHSPPEGHDQGHSGAWKVVSYTVRDSDEGIVHEYQVLLDALGVEPLPMDEGEVRYLLKYSTFAT